MTIKEIAEKYGIPYNIAYQGTYGVKPVNTAMRDRDFPEAPVVAGIIYVLQDRITRLNVKAEKLQMMLEKVNKKAE